MLDWSWLRSFVFVVCANYWSRPSHQRRAKCIRISAFSSMASFSPVRSYRCEGADEEAAHDSRWLFSTAEALNRSREQSRERASASLKSLIVETRTAGAGKETRPLSSDESLGLCRFYAKTMPELCALCAAPADVRWAAIVFYQRFFSVRSPMEFDPLTVMFSCVHLACKIEESHEITLDRILEAADFGDQGLKPKVASLELVLLEALKFTLLVEPKPEATLGMLLEELKERFSLPEGVAREQRRLLDRAADLVLELSVSSDAVLRWPPSLLFAAALLEALQGQGSPSLVPAELAAVASLEERRQLAAGLEGLLEAGEGVGESRSGSLRQVLGQVRDELRAVAVAAAAEGRGFLARPAKDALPREVAKIAKRGQKLFEKKREDQQERQEASRFENRKRIWSDMKGGSGLGSGGYGHGVLKVGSALVNQALVEINQRAAELRMGFVDESDGLGDFVLHRVRDDDAMDS
eukprot:TRINITY_DN850_c0_g1_i1.p1 TRINITY_DN850_c0_g1~~TRINITY_DN850_c0_g1_i1.p1  ORF type:complete len:467 (+),score=93.92 TRINITY_DN850_c0_g1_i1:19-1419(+)